MPMRRDVRRHIVAVRKNDDGDITGFELSDHTVVDYQSALQLAKHGELDGVDVYTRYGREIIRSEADGTPENNLDNLPPF